MTDKIVVLCTAPSSEEADKLAQKLIDERLAACVSILPGLRSLYRWQGKIEQSQEYLLIIKTSRSLFPVLQAQVEALHSYDVPELLAIPVVDGAPNYLNWLAGELRPTDAG